MTHEVKIATKLNVDVSIKTTLTVFTLSEENRQFLLLFGVVPRCQSFKRGSTPCLMNNCLRREDFPTT